MREGDGEAAIVCVAGDATGAALGLRGPDEGDVLLGVETDEGGRRFVRLLGLVGLVGLDLDEEADLTQPAAGARAEGEARGVADDGAHAARHQPSLLAQLARRRRRDARVVGVRGAPRRLPEQRHRVVRRALEEQDPWRVPCGGGRRRRGRGPKDESARREAVERRVRRQVGRQRLAQGRRDRGRGGEAGVREGGHGGGGG